MRFARLKKNGFSVINILQSKLFISLGFIVLIFISIALAREIVHRREISRQIQDYKSEIANLEQKKVELGSLIEYLKTPSFKEKEARTRLGLQKPGESVISVPEGTLNNENSDLNTETGSNSSQTPDSNPKKWWDYIFNK